MKWHNLRKNPKLLPDPEKTKNEYVVLVKLKDGDYARDLACYGKHGWLFELYDEEEEIEEIVAWHNTLSVNPGWLT